MINIKELTKEQKQLIKEMKQQGAEHSIIKWALMSLESTDQIDKMMDYLISIREEHIPKGKVIGMIDKISESSK